VDLRRSGEEFLNNHPVDIDRRLRYDVTDRFDVLLKILQFLVDHGAVDSLDLRLLFRVEWLKLSLILRETKVTSP